jgi:hypothetical protein
MTVEIINIGSSETSGDGESIRSAFNKINNNFASFRNGYSGSQGSTGYTGSQGDTGYVGSASTEIGYTGSQGDDGLQGITGFTGSQGNIGFTGSRGSTGFTGSNGSVGFTGSIGPQGYTGDMGDQGATGYTGSHGSTGFTGSQGTTGYVGSHGSTGYTGSKGDIGNTGNIGYTGSTGYVGSNGDLGFTGSHGYTGSKGDLGYTGSAGSSGTTGYTGSKGDTGYIGSHGYTGSKGDIGNTGSAGSNGFTGSKGDTGYFGSHGYTGSQGVGYTGSSGTTGFTGSTGPASTVGNLNYVQNSQASSTSMPSSPSLPFTVISAPAITTNGSPVQVIVTGDANPLINSAWCQMRLYRGTTAIGQIVQAESTTSNVNVPYSIQFVDAVAAGTYTYSMKVTGNAGGFNFGEATGPVITVTELQNVIGTTGYTGSSGPGYTGSAGTGYTGSKGDTGATGYVGSAGVLTGAIPAWTSAGAITITATTTNPTKGATKLQDNISYRQIGAKEWEIVLTYIQTANTGGNSGSGDYLITLPNGLSFDTTLPSQQIYTGNIGTSTWAHNPYVIPNGNGTITNLNVGGNIFPMVYNATKFRILTLTYGSGIQCWGSGYYSVGGDNPRIQLSFRFTST